MARRTRTYWAAYAGSAMGSEISVHRTERGALWTVVRALGLDEEYRGLTPESPEEDIREALDSYCSTRADDWHVNEVEISK